MSSIPNATQEALAAQKRQSVKETRQKLELAIRRLANGNPKKVKKGTKITAASVAKEAGVDRATLYRFHEPVLVEIRKLNDTEPKDKLQESRSELSLANIKLKEYRELIEEAQGEVQALARINYRLDAKISQLESDLKVRDQRISGLLQQLNECNSRLKLGFSNNPLV